MSWQCFPSLCVRKDDAVMDEIGFTSTPNGTTVKHVRFSDPLVFPLEPMEILAMSEHLPELPPMRSVAALLPTPPPAPPAPAAPPAKPDPQSVKQFSLVLKELVTSRNKKEILKQQQESFRKMYEHVLFEFEVLHAD